MDSNFQGKEEEASASDGFGRSMGRYNLCSGTMTRISQVFFLWAAAVFQVVQSDPVVCPIITAVDNSTHVDTSDGFEEISGLAVSTTQVSPEGNPIFFAANDGGNGPQLGVWDSLTGERLLTLSLREAINQDWEAMAIGSCGGDDEDESCIYIGDIGDNTGRASGGERGRDTTYRILKIREPIWTDYDDDDEIPVVSTLAFDYRHPSSPTRYADSEALFVDHTDWGGSPGDLYIVTKWDCPFMCWYYNRIFLIPVSAWEDAGTSVYSPETVGWNLDSTAIISIKGEMWTSADLSPDGTVLALGTYYSSYRTYLFLRCPGVSIEQAISQNPCISWLNPEIGQTETIAWMPDGRQTLQIPEGRRPGIGRTTLSYNADLATEACPVVRYDDQGNCRSIPENEIWPSYLCDAGADFYSDIGFPLGSPPSPSPAPPPGPPTAPVRDWTAQPPSGYSWEASVPGQTESPEPIPTPQTSTPNPSLRPTTKDSAATPAAGQDLQPTETLSPMTESPRVMPDSMSIAPITTGESIVKAGTEATSASYFS